MALELHVWFVDTGPKEDDFGTLQGMAESLKFENRGRATAIEYEIVEVPDEPKIGKHLAGGGN